MHSKLFFATLGLVSLVFFFAFLPSPVDATHCTESSWFSNTSCSGAPDAVGSCHTPTACVPDFVQNESSFCDCSAGDTTPPVITGVLVAGDGPLAGYVTTDTTPAFTFNTDENAFCRYSPLDRSYDSMVFNCEAGEGGTFHACNGDSGALAYSPGSQNVSIACRDTVAPPNSHTSANNRDISFAVNSLLDAGLISVQSQVGLDVDVSNTLVPASGGVPPYAWSWDYGDGSPPASGQDPIVHTYSGGGNYTIRLTVTDSLGTSDTKQITVAVSAGAATASNIPSFTINNLSGSVSVDAGTSYSVRGDLVELIGGFPIGGETLKLRRLVGMVWTNVAGASGVTDFSNGVASFSWTPGVGDSGRYHLRFNGSANFAPINSQEIVLTVNVPSFCTGTTALSFSSDPAAAGSQVTPSVSGLVSCTGNLAFFKTGSCSGSTFQTCTILASGGCTAPASFTAPAVDTPYFACVNMGNPPDADFTDFGESDAEMLNILAGSPLPFAVTATCVSCSAGPITAGGMVVYSTAARDATAVTSLTLQHNIGSGWTDIGTCPPPPFSDPKNALCSVNFLAGYLAGTTVQYRARANNATGFTLGAVGSFLVTPNASCPTSNGGCISGGACSALGGTSGGSCGAGVCCNNVPVPGGTACTSPSTCTTGACSVPVSGICTIGTGQCCAPAVCGNSTQEPGETCDDGNTTSGDGCSSTCQIEGGGGGGSCNNNGTCDAGETNGSCPADCPAGGGGGAPTTVIISFQNPLGSATFTGLINNIINFLFTIAVILAPILLVVAGVIFMTAAGDPGKVKTARSMLLWTIVGFGVILISKGLVTVLKGILGVVT